MLKLTSKNVLEGIMPGSDCENYFKFRWLSSSSTKSFYIGDKQSEKAAIYEFISNRKKCYIDKDSFLKYLSDLEEIVVKFRFLFYDSVGVFQTIRTHFAALSKEDSYIYLSYSANDRYLKAASNDSNVNEFRNALVPNITNLKICKEEDKYTIYVNLIDGWRDQLMKANSKLTIEKMCEIYNDCMAFETNAGNSSNDAALIFGIKYAQLFDNFSSNAIEDILQNSQYNDVECIDQIKRGMAISSSVIWESNGAKERINLKSEFKAWLKQKTKSNGELWSIKSINNCISNFIKGFNAFEKFEDYDSCYEITELSVFKEYRAYLDTQDGVDEFSKDETNRWFLKALDEYSLFLEEYNSISVDNYTWNCNTVGKQGINKIFYGVPGCGKSHYIEHEILKKNLITKMYEGEYSKENIIRTTFYQDYSNTDFVGQILPKIVKGVNGERDTVEYIFNPGPFTLALIQAISNPTKKVALIIEEINRGNAPAIFGDIFQLLDRDDNGISEYGIVNVGMLDYLNSYEFTVDGVNKRYVFKEIKIPDNMDIFATMNTSDQNVYTLDTAFTRRWAKERIPNSFNNNEIEDYLVPGMEKCTWGVFVDSINNQIQAKLDDLQVNEDKQVGAFFVKKSDLLSQDNNLNDEQKKLKAKSFAHKVLEYLWDDVSKLDHSVIFNPTYKTFEKVVEDYLKNGSAVFNSEIFKNKPTQEATANT